MPLSITKPLSPLARTLLENYPKIQRLSSEHDKAQPQEQPIELSELSSDWNHEKVQFVGPLESALLLQQAGHKQDELEILLRKQQERLNQLKHEKSGLHFTIACLWVFSLCMAALVLWIALH